VREWLERENCIDALVWDAGDKIAGYCSLWKKLDEENVTYIATLNVAPQFQKRSLGRRFLTHFVERSVELGSVRLDLHTWPGNLKAVPLYKKCGFFWMPGTGVHMLNFMPAILKMPCAQSYFKKHDWYRTFKRELSQAEDDERWEGTSVFAYNFEEGGDSLKVWADRESRTITAVETDDFFAASIADEIAPPRGLKTTLRWKLTNKRSEPIAASLIASGRDGFKINHRAMLELGPGESTMLEAKVAILPDAPDIKKDKPAPYIKSVLVIGGEVLELATGLRPRDGVEVGTHPEHITLLPGVPQVARIQLRSRLKRDVEATVGIAPAEGLTADWVQKAVEIPSEGYSGLPVTLRADTGGVFRLPVSVNIGLNDEKILLPSKTLTVLALPVGGVLGAWDGDKLLIENDTVRLIVQKEGGRVEIYDRVTGELLATQGGYAAPPNWPSEYQVGTFDLSLARGPDGVLVEASMESKDNPGFILTKRIKVNSSPTFSIEYGFENLSREPLEFRLYQFLMGQAEDATLTLPLASGLARGSYAEFPGPPDDGFKKPEAYAQRWAARESGGATLGVVWADDIEDIDWRWGFNLLTRFYQCPPQSRVHPKPLYIYVGDGDWRKVQRLWQRLVGQRPSTHGALPQPSLPLTARIDPAVAVASDGRAKTTLLVENKVPRKWSGKVSLTLPEGWQADVTELNLTDVYWQKPYCVPLTLSTKGEPRAETGRIDVRSDEFDADFGLPLVHLGDGRSVKVDESKCEGLSVLTVDNGRIEIDITPGFSATVSTLRENGVNHLASPFPNAQTLGWMSPWYGGLMPMITLPGERIPGKLYKEAFEAQPISIRDSQGIEWHGVRQRGTLKHEDMLGLTVEMDTLTVGGSPVFKQVMRLINATPIVRRLDAGWIAFIQPDGSRSKTTLWGPHHQLKHTDRIAWIQTGHWAAAENPDTGRAVALISPLPEVLMASWGLDGGHLAILPSLDVPAEGQVEVVAYIVLADDVESVRRFAALKDLV
jgi:RimJ/RimL family protein N-acetyltransferase